MQSLNGKRIVYDRELLQRVWQDQQRRLGEEQAAKALKELTQRAPIAAVNKARKETSEGTTKGVKGFGRRSLEQASERYKQRKAKK